MYDPALIVKLHGEFFLIGFAVIWLFAIDKIAGTQKGGQLG
jgi:hypothetical protein